MLANGKGSMQEDHVNSLLRLRRATAGALAVVVVAVIVAGCGSDNKKSDTSTPPPPPPPAASSSTTSGSSSSGKAQVIKLEADPGGALKFTQTKLTAKAGKVTLDMSNASQIPHGIGVDGNGVDVDGQTVEPGQQSKATADLKPGTYEYYCTVPSHKAAGMKGTLVVK
ncbi:MAG: hypothetical protein QOJ89_503 [bacterium]